MENGKEFEEFLEGFVDLLNCLEASIVKMKQEIAKIAGVPEATEQSYAWDPAAIRWEKAQGSKGEFEKSTDVNNNSYKALVQDLKAHGGKLSRDGYFYWLFTSGSVVGRKRRVRSSKNACHTQIR